MPDAQPSRPQTASGPGSGAADPAERRLPPPGETAAPTASREAQAALREWIDQNPTAALLGGFAAGGFIGVLMRR